MFLSAIIPAAGYGKRLKSNISKPLVKIGNTPILIRTLRALNNVVPIKEIILVVNKKDICKLKDIISRQRIKKLKCIVLGGKRRQDSVRNGLKYLDKRCDFVLIHDGARPFIQKEIVLEVIDEAKRSRAAVTGVALKPTIKRCDSRNHIVETLDRNRLFEIQTPQVFSKELIMKAHERFYRLNVTDDAALVEKLGAKVKLVEGSYLNIKITTPEDLVLAKAINKRLE